MKATLGHTNNVKFVFNGEVRKMSAVGSYNEMVDTICQAYAVSPGSFKVKYEDEDAEFITVESQEDFLCALESFTDTTPKFHILPTRTSSAYSVVGMDEVSHLANRESVPENEGDNYEQVHWPDQPMVDHCTTITNDEGEPENSTPPVTNVRDKEKTTSESCQMPTVGSKTTPTL